MRWPARRPPSGRGAIPLRDGDGVVVISHTAETSYARRSRALAQQAGAPLVSVTGRVGAWPEAIETVSREESETYTVSYTATLAVLTLLAEELGSTTYTRRALAATVTKVERALLREVTVPLPARALAITGAGPWGVTAREGALKLREAARVLAEGFDAEYLLHGSAVPLGPADGLVLLEPDADRDGLVTALGEAAAAERIPVSRLSLDTDLPPVLAQIPMTVVLQRLAASWARLRAQDPDVAIVGAWAEPTLWEARLLTADQLVTGSDSDSFREPRAMSHRTNRSGTLGPCPTSRTSAGSPTWSSPAQAARLPPEGRTTDGAGSATGAVARARTGARTGAVARARAGAVAGGRVGARAGPAAAPSEPPSTEATYPARPAGRGAHRPGRRRARRRGHLRRPARLRGGERHPVVRGPGAGYLVAIAIGMVAVGALLLKALRVGEPVGTSVLAIGILAVVVLVGLTGVIFSVWMFLAIPAVAAASYALAHWVTTPFVEPRAAGPEHDVR